MADVTVTMVFSIPLETWKAGNPFKVETPWGKPEAVALGDILDRANELEEKLDALPPAHAQCSRVQDALDELEEAIRVRRSDDAPLHGEGTLRDAIENSLPILKAAFRTPAECCDPPYEELRKTNVELMAKLREARSEADVFMQSNGALTSEVLQLRAQVERLQHQNDALNRALDVYRLAVDEQPFAPSHSSTMREAGK